MKNILIGLIPALMWGIQPLIMTKIGGRASETVIGMASGILLSALVIFFIRQPDNFSLYIFVLSFLDGIALSYGLTKQIQGLNILGVSRGIPISTGSQLIGASLVGALYFKEWTSASQYILGIIALTLIVVGISFTAFQEKKSTSLTLGENRIREGIRTLLLSSLGFIAYTVILRLANISIWDALIGQGLGILLASLFISKRYDKETLLSRKTLQHMLTGFIFAIANISLMISNSINGLALGFTLTQMNVVIASLGGIFILKEKKTSQELRFTIIGLFLVVTGGILIGINKGLK